MLEVTVLYFTVPDSGTFKNHFYDIRAMNLTRRFEISSIFLLRHRSYPTKRCTIFSHLAMHAPMTVDNRNFYSHYREYQFLNAPGAMA